MGTAIVTADRNWAIGKSGKKLTTIPEDVKYIREVGFNKNIIMGRRTYESILDSQLLNDRHNIVLTGKKDYKARGAVTASSVEEAMAIARENGGDIIIIGGESVYREMLDYCDEVEVTRIDYNYDADAYFPDLDKKPEWVMVATSDEQTHFDTVFYFKKYAKRKDYAGRL